ncbi:hypothetical protein [Arthrobacter rhombi]|uniref:hypothetical protein n=1 Tax=Arthrobacter rhombi TaxID=71253 RepID=UPI0031E1CF77
MMGTIQTGQTRIVISPAVAGGIVGWAGTVIGPPRVDGPEAARPGVFAAIEGAETTAGEEIPEALRAGGSGGQSGTEQGWICLTEAHDGGDAD